MIIIIVKGLIVWLNQLKVIGKTNRLKEMRIFAILANFVYFPCNFVRNLFILLNLLQSCPAHKIDHFPYLRILFLYKVYPVLTSITQCLQGLPNWYKDQQFAHISFVSIHAPCLYDIRINALVYTIVCYAWELYRCSSVSNAWLNVDGSHRLLCMNCVEIWSFEMLISR